MDILSKSNNRAACKTILFLVKNLRVLGKFFLRGWGVKIEKFQEGRGVKTEKCWQGVVEWKNFPKGGMLYIVWKLMKSSIHRCATHLPTMSSSGEKIMSIKFVKFGSIIGTWQKRKHLKLQLYRHLTTLP